MEFDDQMRRFFGTDDLGAVSPEGLASGIERMLVEFGLETDKGRRPCKLGESRFTLQLTGSRVLQGNGALDSVRRGKGRFADFVRILMLQNLYL